MFAKGTRNTHGVKDAIDRWRTIGDYRYIAWLSFPTENRITKYRAAGIRCRRFGEELFVHVFDLDKAGAIDLKEESTDAK